MMRIGFLGLGAMGTRMAANLLAAGHDLTVWNRTPERAASLVGQGARVAKTPRDAAKDAEFVIAMLRDDEASRAAWTEPEDGALAGMATSALAIECSTLSLDWARELASICSGQSLSFIDAPLAGSRPQAEAKTLIFFAGGEQTMVERIRPVLLNTGAAVHHAGPCGCGMAVKLAVNMLFATQVAAMGELLELLRRNGLDPARGLELIGATPVCAPGVMASAEMMLRDAHAPLFPIELVEKDLGYAEVAAGTPDRGLITHAVRSVFKRAITAGFHTQHITAVAKLYRP